MDFKKDLLSHTNLITELLGEPNDFRNYLRMDETAYKYLLNLVTPLILKSYTVMRRAITPHERLSATLRFLATGRSYEDMKFSTCFSKSSLCQIIPETCKAIYRVLKDEYLKFPTTQDEWKKISMDFEEKWNFPHCLGAVDGKHINITAPHGSGSYFFNYKKSHSIVLMAIVNANYEFIMCNIGTNGRVSDGGVIENTSFWEKLINKDLNLPAAESIIENEPVLNYVFIGDEAFALSPNFLKPYNQRELNYEKRIFNYRLARARRVVENTFGILANRFKIFHTPINVHVNNTDNIVLACCALHNFLRRQCYDCYTSPEELDIEDTTNGAIVAGDRTDSYRFLELQRGCNMNYTIVAKETRDLFKVYFIQMVEFLGRTQ